MQAAYQSDSPGGASNSSDAPPDVWVDAVFQITSHDTNILQHYLDEFQGGDTSARTLLINRIMGELYRLQPVNSPFDKKDAMKVWHLSSIA